MQSNNKLYVHYRWLACFVGISKYFDFLKDYMDMYLSFTRICLFKDCVLFHKHWTNLQATVSSSTQLLSQVPNISTKAQFKKKL